MSIDPRVISTVEKSRRAAHQKQSQAKPIADLGDALGRGGLQCDFDIDTSIGVKAASISGILILP